VCGDRFRIDTSTCGDRQVVTRWQGAASDPPAAKRFSPTGIPLSPRNGLVPINVEALTGAWRNVNPGGANTRVEFRIDQGRVVVHAWGNCLPTDCDWGEVSTPLSDADDGVLSLTWNSGFSVVSPEFRLLQDGHLESWCHDHYTDNSGRADFDFVEYLRKSG